MAPKQPPPLNPPPSTTTVNISAIDTTLRMVGISCDMMWNPPIKGFDRVRCGTWSFLIEHPSGRKLLYDLGCRKDWQKLPPVLGLEKLMQNGILEALEIEKDVSEILVEGGVDLKEVEGVVWSHWHFDHTGDPSTFPPTTKLIVGPGFKESFLPGYPTNPHAHVLDSDFAGRELLELNFNGPDVKKIGRFKALDYFGDGSFYILDSPGHAIGHINALARTHTAPPGFVHLGGDSVHHAAEIRPSEYLPLPDSILPSPLPSVHRHSCPGDIFSPILRNGSKTEPILELHDAFGQMSGDAKFGLIVDEVELRETIEKDVEFDAQADVFTVIAHDWSLKGVIDEWPNSLNAWREKGWKEGSQWKFLEEFGEAVSQ